MDSDQKPVVRHKSRPSKSEKISLYVHDKYAAKYTFDQLDLILRRSKASGQQSAAAVWILFILFAIFVDFLRFKSFLTSQETYQVEKLTDGGLISNFLVGKFGWPLAVFLISCVSAAIIECITSDSYLYVAAASAAILSVEISTIVTCMALNALSSNDGKDRSSLRLDLFGSLNLAVACLMCLSWVIWHSIELILLIHGTKRVQNAVDMNHDTTLLSRQRLKVKIDTPHRRSESDS